MGDEPLWPLRGRFTPQGKPERGGSCRPGWFCLWKKTHSLGKFLKKTTKIDYCGAVICIFNSTLLVEAAVDRLGFFFLLSRKQQHLECAGIAAAVVFAEVFSYLKCAA